MFILPNLKIHSCFVTFKIWYFYFTSWSAVVV